jgi:hypothetical protein
VFDDSVNIGRPIDEKIIVDFRKNIHGLGGFWIFAAAVCAIIGAALLGGNMPVGDRIAGADELLGAAVVVLILAGLWLIFGVCTCLKQTWAVYAGLALSYVSLLGNLYRVNICGLVVMLLVVIQGHRTLKLAGQMKRARIPLTAKAEDLRARVPAS